MLLDKVVLLQDIKYVKKKKKVVIKKGTELLVDRAKNIALYGNDHIDIQATEYTLVSMIH